MLCIFLFGALGPTDRSVGQSQRGVFWVSGTMRPLTSAGPKKPRSRSSKFRMGAGKEPSSYPLHSPSEDDVVPKWS